MSAPASIPLQSITGLVLAGGRGRRMGGVDKGLQPHLGGPLAWHAAQRLAPQVGSVMISANRNLGAYEAFGVPVWPDACAAVSDSHSGPLAGFLAGLEHCSTPYLATVPCDSPAFPSDLVARLATALAEQGAEVAMAASRDADTVRAQPVFCLMRVDLADGLRRYMASGQRMVERWAAQQRCVEVVFDNAAAFVNANTSDELRQLQQRQG